MSIAFSNYFEKKWMQGLLTRIIKIVDIVAKHAYNKKPEVKRIDLRLLVLVNVFLY